MKIIRQDNDFIKILANTAWLIFDKVFILVLNLLVSVKIANYYGASGYGSYQYVVSIIAVLEIITTFVDGRVVKKKYLTYDPDVVVMTATVTRILLAGLAVMSGGILLFFQRNDAEFTVLFFVLLINMALGNIKFGMANRFEYLLKSRKIVVASNIAATVASLLQLAAVHFKWPLKSLAFIAITSTIISSVMIVIQYRMEFENRKKGSVDWELLRSMLKESLPLAVAGSCGVLYNRCDSIMLGAMLTSSEVGIYSISVSLVSIVQIVIAPVRESVYPKLLRLYSEDKSKYEECYVQISSALTWVYIIGVCLSFVILPYAFQFLNSEYAQAFSVYRIHVLGSFFMYNAALRSGHFTIINRGSILTYSQVISVAANVILNLAGIKLFGIYGAALATALTQAGSLMFINLFFKKEGREVFRWQVQALNPVHIWNLLRKNVFGIYGGRPR